MLQRSWKIVISENIKNESENARLLVCEAEDLAVLSYYVELAVSSLIEKAAKNREHAENRGHAENRSHAEVMRKTEVMQKTGEAREM